jgi:hypothetical protein
VPGLANAESPEGVQVAEIYQLQAAFHRAKTTQDLDLMMSLWADDATFDFAGGGFDNPTVKTIVNDTFLAGTLRDIHGSWLFWSMTAGPSSPLFYDHYYFP